MIYAWFSLPEWQGEKKSDRRPCVVRKTGSHKSWVIPISTKYYSDEVNMFMDGLYKTSFGVMPAEYRHIVSNDELEFIGAVPEEIENDIYVWELRHEVFNLDPEEYKHAITLV